MKSINIINVSGKEFFVDNRDSFMDVMEHFGISEEDVMNYVLTDTMKEELVAGHSCACKDGIYGDDFYTMCEDMYDCLHEFKEVAISLRSTSRKCNTRADLANRLDTICSNFEHYIP